MNVDVDDKEGLSTSGRVCVKRETERREATGGFFFFVFFCFSVALSLLEQMWFTPRSKKWIFKLRDVPHKVELRQKMCQKVTLAVDGEVVEWEQSLLDLLDFGGKFRFTLYSGVNTAEEAAHECFLVINLWHIYLFVDGLDIERGKRFSFSGGRIIIGILVVCAVCLLLWTPIEVILNFVQSLVS